MAWNCWWELRRVGTIIHRRRPHRWVGRAVRRWYHYHAAVVKVLVCTAGVGTGLGLGWSSTWGSPSIVPPLTPYYGEVGPEWWSAGLVPSPFLTSGSTIGAEFFAPPSVEALSSPLPNSAVTPSELAFGRVIARGVERQTPIERAFHTSTPTTTRVPEPGSVCALLSAFGLLTLARTICRQ